jgi:hypothetical protein
MEAGEPSLRANGSRECAPDERLREAIHGSTCCGMDCYVAALLAMTLLVQTKNIMLRASLHRGAGYFD